MREQSIEKALAVARLRMHRKVFCHVRGKRRLFGSSRMTPAGLVLVDARCTAEELPGRAEAAFERRGIRTIARIDHSAAAAIAGISLPTLTVFIFGNPELGSPLMESNPTLGIDLPLKLLVASDEGAGKVGYNDPRWLVSRHGGDPSDPAVETMETLLAALAAEVAGA